MLQCFNFMFSYVPFHTYLSMQDTDNLWWWPSPVEQLRHLCNFLPKFITSVFSHFAVMLSKYMCCHTSPVRTYSLWIASSLDRYVKHIQKSKIIQYYLHIIGVGNKVKVGGAIVYRKRAHSKKMLRSRLSKCVYSALPRGPSSMLQTAKCVETQVQQAQISFVQKLQDCTI